MKKRSVAIIVFAVLTLAVILGSGTLSPISSVVYANATSIQWDIVSVAPPTADLIADPGGEASAKAQDGSKITLTGSGTFVAPREGQRSSVVTGGGTWETFDASGNSTGTGTYQVTSLVSWHDSPGMLPPLISDNIGNASDSTSGLAVMTIEFSDGSQGVLVVSCFFPGAPPSIFEGITVSKGFVDYWERQNPQPNIDGERTIFHIVRNP